MGQEGEFQNLADTDKWSKNFNQDGGPPSSLQFSTDRAQAILDDPSRKRSITVIREFGESGNFYQIPY